MRTYDYVVIALISWYMMKAFLSWDIFLAAVLYGLFQFYCDWRKEWKT